MPSTTKRSNTRKGGKPPARWGLEANFAFILGLLTVIEELGEKEHNYKEQILAALNSAGLPGPPYTWEGARKHLQKLRKKEGGDGAASSAVTTPKPAPALKTPRKRAPAKPKNGAKTPATKGKRKASEAVATDDGNDTDESPAPTIKKLKGESDVDNDMDQFVNFENDNDSGAV